VDVPNDLTTALSNFLGTLMGGRASLPVGGGTATAQVSGVLSVNTTEASTGADTNETDLWTYSLPANTLNANGKSVRIRAWGSCAATANNKTIRLYFGATVLRIVANAAAINNGTWHVDAVVVRTAATAQTASAWKWEPIGGIGMSTTTPAETLASAVAIKVTGQNGTAAANDVVFSGAIVEVLN
jgi:hypothetical protein